MIENTVVWQSVGSLVYKLKEGRGFTEGKRNLENEVWFNISLMTAIHKSPKHWPKRSLNS